MPQITPFLALVLAAFAVFVGAVAYGRLITHTIDKKK